MNAILYRPMLKIYLILPTEVKAGENTVIAEGTKRTLKSSKAIEHYFGHNSPKNNGI